MANTTTVEIEGVTFTVKFDYYPEIKDTWDCPGCNDGVDIESITIGDGPEMYELLDKWVITAITNAVIQECRDE